MSTTGAPYNIKGAAHRISYGYDEVLDEATRLKQERRAFTMDQFVRPDHPSKCTWTRTSKQEDSPHYKAKWEPPKKIMPNALHIIGHTPMVRLNKIPQSLGVKCEILAKCEFFNPGGSVKDRIGYRMVVEAERAGKLEPGCTLIEPTSGNTGIGIALAGAIKGYKCIIVMPEKMSNEKVDVLRALGAKIIRTPTEAAFDSPEGLLATAQKLQKQIPNSHILNQYTNPGNPLAHYDTTAEEIYHQCDGKIDMVVMGAGTGGTVTGVGRRLKELLPNLKFVAVDPHGSILAQPESLNKSDVTYYEVEGIGYDFIPTVLDRSVVDQWIKIGDMDAFPMARRLIREEGLLCGGSSGAALSAAIKVAKELKEGQRCVVLLPDGVRNYMTKFLDDHWMEARHFKEPENTENHWWWNNKVSALTLESPVVVGPSTTCLMVLNKMKKQGIDQIPVEDKGVVIGMATITNLMSLMINNKVQANDPISKAINKKFIRVTPDSILGLVARVLEKEPFVLVTSRDAATPQKETINGIVTNIDLLNYITQNKGN